MKMLTEQRLRELLEEAYDKGAQRFAYPYLSALDKLKPDYNLQRKEVVDKLIYKCDRE